MSASSSDNLSFGVISDISGIASTQVHQSTMATISHLQPHDRKVVRNAVWVFCFLSVFPQLPHEGRI